MLIVQMLDAGGPSDEGVEHKTETGEVRID